MGSQRVKHHWLTTTHTCTHTHTHTHARAHTHTQWQKHEGHSTIVKAIPKAGSSFLSLIMNYKYLRYRRYFHLWTFSRNSKIMLDKLLKWTSLLKVLYRILNESYVFDLPFLIKQNIFLCHIIKVMIQIVLPPKWPSVSIVQVIHVWRWSSLAISL